MSKWDCAKCGQDAESDGCVWMGEGGVRICRECASALAKLGSELLGLPVAFDAYGLCLEWAELDRIVQSLEYDVAWRQRSKTIVLTDRALREADPPWLRKAVTV